MQKKLKARILSLALSALMVTSMMPTTVFATEGGNVAPGASSVGEIQSFNKLEDRFSPSTGKDAPSHVYGLAVELDAPEKDLNLPDELSAMVERTTTVATPSDATEDATEEIKNEEVPLAPEPELEQDEETVTTVEQETIPVEWTSDKKFTSDKDGKFIYTATLPEGYILADVVKLPRIFVVVGGRARAATEDVIIVGGGSATSGYETADATALKKAFTDIPDGGTVKLGEDIDLGTAGITLSKGMASVKLDLNGKTITYSGSSGAAIWLNNGFLEITDTESGGSISATASPAIFNSSTGTVNVSGGTVSATTGYAIRNNGTGTVNVSGGTVSATTSYAIYNSGTGTVNVSGGTVSATTGPAIYNSKTGAVTISQADGKTTTVTSANTDDEQGTIYLEAGAATDTVLTITGGTVSNTANPEGYSIYNKAAGIMDIGETAIVGKIYPEPPAAKIGNMEYATLQAAFTAVADGQTITLLADIDLRTKRTTLNKAGASVTLDLNGKKITYSGDGSAITLSAGSLEIKDTASGGTISATGGYTGYTIYNDSTGTVTVSGGTVSTTNGWTIYNASTGNVAVSGGTVSATTGMAIANFSTGKVTVSGGTVNATTGMAIGNASTGLITISQAEGKTTLVTSANPETAQGTIYLAAGATTNMVLAITGGTVENTATPDEGYSVYNTASGKMNISAAATVGKIYPEPAPAYTGTQATSPSSTPAEKKATSIKLAPVAVTGETVEYAYSTSSTAPTDDSKWQTGTEFTELTADTQYYFFARVKENDKHKAGTASTGTAIKTDKTDADKVADAKTKANTALGNLTATNATTAADVLNAVKNALTGTGVTATWNSDPSDFSKTDATDSDSGSITGTIKLTCGTASDTVSVSLTIAQLGSDAEKLANAKTAALAALNGYTATNDTTANDVMALVNTALTDGGFTGMTATWKGDADFNKTNATNAATGSVTGTITLTLNGTTTDVMVNMTIAKLPAPTPEKPTITVGNGGSNHQISSGKDITFTCSGALEDLEGIYVDGKLVDPSNYTLKSGSTILTLKASYLDTLSVGKHTLKFQYKDNVSAETNFTITAKAGETPTTKPSSPQTGDSSNLMILFTLLLASGGTLTALLVRRRKTGRHYSK